MVLEWTPIFTSQSIVFSLYSIVGVGVTGPPQSTNRSGRALQAISSVMFWPQAMTMHRSSVPCCVVQDVRKTPWSPPCTYDSCAFHTLEVIKDSPEQATSAVLLPQCTSLSIHSTCWGPFYSHGLTLIPVWISNYIHYKVWDEITYPFLNLNGATVEV